VLDLHLDCVGIQREDVSLADLRRRTDHRTGTMPQKYSHPEIERRWLVREDKLPPLSTALRREIEDRYIHGGRLRLRAVRAEGVDPIFKLGKKYVRIDAEPEDVVSIYLSEQEYELLQMLPGAIVRKARYSIEGGSLDVYETPPSSPIIFSIEFKSQADATKYSPPSFVGEEVTFDARYTGHAFAQEAR
jgi:CYTH domain-containing protein